MPAGGFYSSLDQFLMEVGDAIHSSLAKRVFYDGHSRSTSGVYCLLEGRASQKLAIHRGDLHDICSFL